MIYFDFSINRVESFDSILNLPSPLIFLMSKSQIQINHILTSFGKNNPRDCLIFTYEVCFEFCHNQDPSSSLKISLDTKSKKLPSKYLTCTLHVHYIFLHNFHIPNMYTTFFLTFFRILHINEFLSSHTLIPIMYPCLCFIERSTMLKESMLFPHPKWIFF